MSEPALTREIPRPWPHRLWRLVPVSPLIGWVLVAVFVLVVHRDSPSPPVIFLPLVCSGIGLIVLALPLVGWSLVQVVSWGRAFVGMRHVVRHLQAHELAEAESICARIVADRMATPAAYLPAMHTLGVVRLVQGDVETAHALMARVRDSGWLETFAFRRHRAASAQARAVCAVVRGELAEAEAELDEARRWARGAAMEAYVQHAATLLALRRGAWGEVLSLSAATDLSHLPERARELAPLYRGLARARQGEEVAIALDPALLPAWLEHWPELATFAREHASMAD